MTSRRGVLPRVAGLSCASFIVLVLVAAGLAQERSTSSTDPRVGLKAGFHNAGEAARNMEVIASLPKPEGFFDPKTPAGAAIAAERVPNSPTGAGVDDPPDTNANAAAPTPPRPGTPPPPRPGAPPPFDPVLANRPSFANSDLAFSGDMVIVGNYHGFNTYDIERADKPRLVSSVVCPGGQGDVSVHGHLLIMSVEQTRGRIDCGVQGVQTAVSGERFRGIRIFDISDISRPKQVAAVQTCRGSHTHTLVVDPNDKANVYVYVSGTSTVRSGDELAGCSYLDPKEDPNTSLYSIDVIQVPVATPNAARIVSKPRVFSDPATSAIAGLWRGGNHGEGTQTSRATNQCHDITVFPEIGLAAGACAGNGILLDIRDPKNPVRIDQVVDKNFAYWHSATFNHEGTKVIFTDEWGGGGRPRCRPTDQPTWGADAIFDIVDRKLRFASYYKMPAPQTEQENCVAHNGSLIPVPGRDIMVQAWYQGGVSIFDFTESAHPVEIAYFDRGPLDPKQLILGGYWSTYWYNGAIYGSEISRGIDVFRLKPSDVLTQHEIDAATSIQSDEVNTQVQKKIVWPATLAVTMAYVDQLTRSNGIQPQRVKAVRAAMERADRTRAGSGDRARGVVTELTTVAAEVEKDAAAASGRDAIRLRALADTMKRRAESLR
jgi:hypothetical protein